MELAIHERSPHLLLDRMISNTLVSSPLDGCNPEACSNPAPSTPQRERTPVAPRGNMLHDVLFPAVLSCSPTSLQTTSQISLPLNPCLRLQPRPDGFGLKESRMASGTRKHEFEPCLCNLLSVTTG